MQTMRRVSIENGKELSFDDVPFRGIIEQSLAGIYVVLDERFMYANDTFAAMFGYPREEFIGRRMVDCVTPDSAEEVMQNYRRRISGEVTSIHYTTKGLRKDGRVVHLELHASRVECRGRPALAGVALDITDRVLRQEQLRQSREQLRKLAKHINTTREVERARLAREVHDVLGGMLSSAKFDLARIVRRTAGPGQEELHAIATDLLALMQETIETTRAISNEMRPTSLDLLGLDVALRQLVERFAARHGLAASVTSNGDPTPIPELAAMQVFRIVQEALTNVGRHAGASAVRLAIEHLGNAFRLTLVDDGCGIDSAPRRPGSIGLFSMAERAREIGAALDITGRPEGGTELKLTLPIRASLAPGGREAQP
jgi:two-component system, NarL family, sensor histidine kinase UhpB